MGETVRDGRVVGDKKNERSAFYAWQQAENAMKRISYKTVRNATEIAITEQGKKDALPSLCRKTVARL